jgi:hypothetical protein
VLVQADVGSGQWTPSSQQQPLKVAFETRTLHVDRLMSHIQSAVQSGVYILSHSWNR